MIQTKDITRPPREWVGAQQRIGAATVSSTLNKMGRLASPVVIP